MFTNHAIINTVNMWKIALKKKILYFDMLFSKKIFYFLKILKSLKLINTFFFYKKKKWIFIRSYVTFRSVKFNLNFFKILSTPSKKFYISLHALKLLAKRTGSSTYLISTSSGIIPHDVSIKSRKTGMLTSLSSS